MYVFRRAFVAIGVLGLAVIGLGSFDYGKSTIPPNVISNSVQAAEPLSPICERLIDNIQRKWRTNSVVELDAAISVYNEADGFRRCGQKTIRSLLLEAE